jgi:RNase adaptor protein for sRNA GlmZ degradation
MGLRVTTVFLDASTGTLVRRYSETRRKHPLSQIHMELGLRNQRRALVDAIELERSMLEAIRAESHVIDSSMIRAAQLQGYIKALIGSAPAQLTLVFESFAFKRGVPSDADFVFDVRMLPNPHYESDLRAQTGRDAPVADFLRAQPEAGQMQTQVTQFLEQWLPAMARDHRSYVTVAIGCTGGQHRSVYMAEVLARCAAHSDEARATLLKQGTLMQRMAYGPSAVEALDWYPSRAPHAPLVFFVHGGAWRRGLAKDYGMAAAWLHERGAHLVVPDFSAVTDVDGDMLTMAEQLQRALAQCAN